MNYSKQQYEQDKRQVKDKKALDELFNQWKETLKSCHYGMINPPENIKNNRIKAQSLISQIKALTKITKKDNNKSHGRDKDRQIPPEIQGDGDR